MMIRVRHIKRGSTYEVLGIGKIQTSDWETYIGGGDYMSVDMSEVVVYRCEDDGSIWVRPKDEFYDGRFEVI